MIQSKWFNFVWNLCNLLRDSRFLDWNRISCSIFFWLNLYEKNKRTDCVVRCIWHFAYKILMIFNFALWFHLTGRWPNEIFHSSVSTFSTNRNSFGRSASRRAVFIVINESRNDVYSKNNWPHRHFTWIHIQSCPIHKSFRHLFVSKKSLFRFKL